MTENVMEKDRDSNAWWEERSLPVKILMVIGFVILGAGLLFLFGFVLKALWNWLMPEIFGLKRISYWQAWGLLVLSRLLFGRIGSGGSGDGGRGADRRRKKQLRSYIMEEQRRRRGETKGPEKSADSAAPDASLEERPGTAPE